MRTIVVLDTNVVRHVAEGIELGARWEELTQLRDSFVFALSDACLVELTYQLLTEDISWETWRTGRQRLTKVIEHGTPIASITKANAYQEDDLGLKLVLESGDDVKVFRWLMQINKLEQLRRRLPVAQIEEGVNASHQRYISLMREMKVDVQSHDTVAAQRRRIKDSSGRDEPPAWLALMDFLSSAALQSGGYTPEDNRSDDVDIRVLLALSLGAHVISNDTKLLNRTRNRNSQRSLHLYRLSEFADRHSDSAKST